MSRIKLGDGMFDVINKMTEGNPGAMNVIMELTYMSEKIDPDSAFGSIGAILLLDSYEIYGSDIYVLWSDICGRNTKKMIAVLRAGQLGIIPSYTIKDASSRQDYSGKDMIDVEDLYKKVCERLPNFDKEK